MKKLIAISFQEHKRSWDRFDGRFYQIAQCPAGPCPTLFREFTTHYKVSRGLHTGKAGEYVSLLEKTLGSGWPTELKDRLSVCGKLVETAKKRGLTNGHQASLASKAIWFKHPTNWFLFDRFVASALRIHRPVGSLERHKTYQEKLHSLDVSTLALSIAGTLKKYDSNLHPERVIDKFLMRIGISFFTEAGIEDKARQQLREGQVHATTASEWATPTNEGLRFANETYETFNASKLVTHLREIALP